MNIPNIELGEAYYKAFEHFNKTLFGGGLPVPMLTMTRDSKVTKGHFAPGVWEREGDNGATVDEIALNSNLMGGKDLQGLMTTLIHEMVHLWQWHFGKPTRNGYHNQEWTAKAQEIGLKVIGQGQCVDTEMADGGRAQEAMATMPDAAVLPWMAKAVGDPKKDDDQGQGKVPPPQTQTKSGKRSKYTCPKCGLNAWAKIGVRLICGDCNETLVETAKDEEV